MVVLGLLASVAIFNDPLEISFDFCESAGEVYESAYKSGKVYSRYTQNDDPSFG